MVLILLFISLVVKAKCGNTIGDSVATIDSALNNILICMLSQKERIDITLMITLNRHIQTGAYISV